MGGNSWVTLATNDSYSLGALVLAHSLKQVGTKQQLTVLITPGVTQAMRSKLSEVFNVVQEVNILDSKDEANLRLLKRPELGVTFTKLHCWRLTQFDKCVFLDADTLVLENCDELFEREELSAAPDIGWPDCFNSGVFVYRPSNDTYEKLIQFALEKGSFDGGDQGLLNLYFSDWAHKDISKHLPFIYNMASTACYSYLPAFKQFGSTAKIIHFIGSSKPWLQYFDTEKKEVHPGQGYEHLKTILQHWWNIFCSLIHPQLSPDMTPGHTDTAHGSQTNFPSNYHYSSDYHSSSPYEQEHTSQPTLNPADNYQNVWDPWEEYDNRQLQNQTVLTETYHESSHGNQTPQDSYCYEGSHDIHHRSEIHHTYETHHSPNNNLDSTPHGSSQHHYHDSRQITEYHFCHLSPNPHENISESNQYDIHDHSSFIEQSQSAVSPFHFNIPSESHNHSQYVENNTHNNEYKQNVLESHNTNACTDGNHSHYSHPSSPFQGYNPPQPQPVKHYDPPVAHNDPPVVHNDPPVAHNDPPVAHKDPPIDRHDPLKNLHNSLTGHYSTPPNSPTREIPQMTEPAPPNQHCPRLQNEFVATTESSDITLQSSTEEVNNSSGIAGAFAKLTLGQPRTPEQLALDDHLRRQGWEVGNIDYLGKDSFDNIWSKICETLSSSPAPPTPKAKVQSDNKASSDPGEQTQALQTLSNEPKTVETEKSVDVQEKVEAEKLLTQQTSAPTQEFPKLPQDKPLFESPKEIPVPGTPAPVAPTPEPVTPTVAATPEPVAPTSEPFTPTSEPVAPTSEPVAPTSEPVAPTSEPVVPTSEPVAPTSELVSCSLETDAPTPKPIAPTPKPVAPTPEPVTPTPEPVTPTTEPVAPAPQPIQLTPEQIQPTPEPVAATTEPAAPTSEPVAPTPEPVAPTLEPVAPTPKPDALISEPASETPKATTETPEPALEGSKPVPENLKTSEKPPKSVEVAKQIEEAPQSVAISPQPAAKPIKEVVETSKPSAAEPQKPVSETSKSAIEPSKLATETLEPVTESPKLVEETSKQVAELPEQVVKILKQSTPNATADAKSQPQSPAEMPKSAAAPAKTESSKAKTGPPPEPSKAEHVKKPKDIKAASESSEVQPKSPEKSKSEVVKPEKPVPSAPVCPIKPKQSTVKDESEKKSGTKKGKEAPKTEVTGTTPSTSPLSPEPKQNKQALRVDTTIPDTPPPAVQDPAASCPTPPPRKSSSGAKKSAPKKK